MCTVLLPPGDNPIAVNKYIYLSKVSVQWNVNFLNRFSKNTQILNFMKIRPVGAEFFFVEGRADRRTESEKDRTKLIVALHYFPNAPKGALLTIWRLTATIWVVPHSKPPDAAFYIFIQQIYVLNILNMLHNIRFFSLQNAVYFIMLPCLVPVLFAF